MREGGTSIREAPPQAMKKDFTARVNRMPGGDAARRLLLTQSVTAAHDGRHDQDLLLAVFVLVGAAATGCSSGLKYKVDDAALDSVGSGEKQGVFNAKNDIEIARSEIRNADSKLEALDRDRDVAKNEKKQAELEIDKAATEEESAVAARDENRHNAAKHGKEVAAFGVKVADSKLEWLDQKEDALKADRKAAEAHQKAAEAKTELEKAKLAQQKNIKPDSDFSVGDFEGQYKDKNSDWESAKKDAASEGKKAAEREQKWKDLVAQQAKMRG